MSTGGERAHAAIQVLGAGEQGYAQEAVCREPGRLCASAAPQIVARSQAHEGDSGGCMVRWEIFCTPRSVRSKVVMWCWKGKEPG